MSTTLSSRSLKLTALLAVLIVSFVVLLPRPAHGCSCVMPDPERLAAEASAAFVGTLIDKVPDPEEGPYRSTGNPATYTFEVERWTKGDLGEIVEVRAPVEGASCGIEVPVGRRAGIFLYVEDGELRSSLCSTVSADAMLAWAEGPTSSDTGIPFLLFGGWAGPHFTVVDQSGHLVRLLDPLFSADDHADTTRFSVCPGGRLAVTRSLKGIKIWDTSTLEEVQSHEIPRYETAGVTGFSCRNEDATSVWFVVPAGASATVVDVFGDDRLGIVRGHHVSLGASHAVGVNVDNHTATRTDLVTGDELVLQQAPAGEIWGIHAAANPSDGTTAVVVTRYQLDVVGATVYIQGESGEVRSEYDLPWESYHPTWLDETRLAVASIDPHDTGQHFLYVIDLVSGSVTRLAGWKPWDVVANGDLVYGIAEGVIWEGNLATEEILPIGTTADENAHVLATFDTGVEVETLSPPSSTGTTVPAAFLDNREPVPGGSAMPVAESSDLAGFLFAAIALGAVGTGVVTIIRKRRTQRTPGSVQHQ